jgi:hypothetical protein
LGFFAAFWAFMKGGNWSKGFGDGGRGVWGDAVGGWMIGRK